MILSSSFRKTSSCSSRILPSSSSLLAKAAAAFSGYPVTL